MHLPPEDQDTVGTLDWALWNAERQFPVLLIKSLHPQAKRPQLLSESITDLIFAP